MSNSSNKQRSYTSAGIFPVKLLKKSTEAIVDGKIIPYHIQLIPTNHCNANCSWCSCSKVDRKSELPTEEVFDILAHFAGLGTQAVTITGGGEPTVHPDIIDIIDRACSMEIECGLVTNGLKWGEKFDKRLKDLSRKITWMRYSIIAANFSLESTLNRLVTFCENLPCTDIGVSFTVPKNVDIRLAV